MPFKSNSASVAASRLGAGSNTARIQLRDGKRCLSLPSWMSVRHLPEYGITASLSQPNPGNADRAPSSSSAPAPTDAASERESRGTAEGESSRGRRGRWRRGEGADANATSVEMKGGAFSAPLVSASNNKTKKEAAMDSLHLPTKREIDGHVRYLSEEGMRLATREVDSCVGYSLKHSATKKRKEEGRGAAGHDDDGESSKKGGKTDLMTLAEEIDIFFTMFQPNVEEEATSLITETKDREAVHRDDILHDMVPRKHDPMLFPMVTIKCHPNVLDRGEMTNGLLSDLSKNSGRWHSQPAGSNAKSPCVCVVRSTAPLVRQGHLVTEVLSQCISNDPDGEEFAAELQRQRKRQKSHHSGGVNGGVLVRSIWDWKRSLVDWAGFTEAFDSITVILEDPENILSPTLDSFFTTLASLRANHGVPIGAVVIDATPGGLGDRLSELRDPALRGMAGVAARELFVPTPQVQLDLFVERLFSGKCVPTFLWTDDRLLRHIRELFQECDNSIVSVARTLKTDLRRYFSVPGAFISLLNCEQFIIPNRSRITWLFGDGQCRKIMTAHSPSDAPLTKKDQRDNHIFDLFWKMQISYVCHQVCKRINAIFDVSPLEEIGQVASSQFCSRSRMRGLLFLLGDVRHRFTTWDGSSTTSSQRSASLLKKLNELIILVGKFESEEESSTFMAKALVKNIMGWATQQFWMQITPEEPPAVQPRRDVAKCLSSMMTDVTANCPLVRTRSTAFRVFQSRVMTLADWHEKYSAAVAADQDWGDVGMRSNEAAFFFAVQELTHCGFVKRLTAAGRRKEEAYEKVAMVWGSGR